MALINETFRFYYVASNFASGLVDVNVKVLTPSNVLQGPFICTESNRIGIYYYDYIPLIKGQYVFEADSVSVPNATVQIKDIASSSSVPWADF
jgi:hypothetical protein